MASFVRTVTEASGFQTRTAGCVASARRRLDAQPVALVVLDLELPDGSGLELVQHIKTSADLSDVRILILTSCADEEVRCLLEGADDFLDKPIDFPRLQAHLVAQRRRLSGLLGPDGAEDGLQLDPGRWTATLDGAPLALTTTEFCILQRLLQRAGWACSRDQLMEAASIGDDSDPRVVDAHIKSIRAKLGADRHRIETVRGVGYRLAPQDT